MQSCVLKIVAGFKHCAKKISHFFYITSHMFQSGQFQLSVESNQEITFGVVWVLLTV